MPPYLLLALALLGSASARHLAALEAPKLGSSALEAVAEVSPVALEDNSECPRDNETVRLSLPGALGGTTYRYVIVKQRRNFHGAQKFCYQCYRGRLASIHSYNSNACLWRKARSRTNRGQVWIGAVTRPLGRNVFCEWVDHQLWNFAHWLRGYPLHSGTFCTSLCTANGRWRSVRCSRRLPFICEY